MPSPILLGVNIDHAATLRQARYRAAGRTVGGNVEPDPVLAARIAEQHGADGITVHLREDRRHIQDEDLRRLRESIASRLNLEMAATTAMLAIALATRPETACLVPESREEITTEGGLDVVGQRERLRPIVRELAAAGIGVSLFIDPDDDAIDAAADLGAPIVELHTGAWANTAPGTPARAAERARLAAGARRAAAAGLVVNAGHGINYQNVRELVDQPEFHEFNIGHAILSRALFTGLPEAVATMKRLLAR